MLALRSAPPVFSIAEAERVARDVYGLAVSAQPLSGERDANFHARSGDLAYVLKILGAADSADCQVRVLRHLADHDPSLPVPRLYATLAGADVGSVTQGNVTHATCLMSHLPGQLLSERMPDSSLLNHVGATLARIDRALQGFFHPALAQRIAWDVRRLPELVQFSPYIESSDVRRQVEHVVRELTEKLPDLRGLRSQAIHGDCHAGNLLIGAPVATGVSNVSSASAAAMVCGVLDFGDMIHAPMILEPAVVMSELLTDGLAEPQGLGAVLEGYVSAQALEAADIALLYDLVTARHATTILLHAWRERHDQQGARVLDRGAANAGPSLDRLLRLGRDSLSVDWHRAAGTSGAPVATIDLGRRHRLLGAGAELFYESPLHLVRGEGVWLYDSQGRAYLDGYNNVPHVGHCHPAVVRAVQKQTALLATHTRYLHERVLDYAEQLIARCPPHLNACIFVNSGSEANDVAWRIAQLITGHRGALIMRHAYHGITEAVAALTPGAGQPHDMRVVALPTPPEGLIADATLTAAELAAAAASTDLAIETLAQRGLAPAAFFIDSALTSSGIYDPPTAWLEAVTTRVRAAGGLVVADEVQYGLGRSGSHFWGFERRGMSPDLVTLGKPMGNGYPMGAVIADRRVIEAFQAAFGFFSTFGGNPVAAAAGLAVLEVIEREQLAANAQSTGHYLRRRLEGMASQFECLGAVRGTGLLLGLEVRGGDAPAARQRATEIVNAMACRARVLIGSEGPAGNILKLRPPLPFRPEHADLLVDAIGAAAAVIEARD